MEGIAEIQKAPDLWRKSALIDKFLPKSDAPAPQGEEREKLKADVEELAAKEKSVLDAKVSIDSINSAESADYAVRVIKGDNGWQVQRPDGSKMDVSSAEAARHIRDDLLQTGSQAEADALLKAIDTRDDGRKGGEIQKNRTFTGESVVGTDDGLERTRFIEPVREILSPKDLDRLQCRKCQLWINHLR